MKWLYLHFHSLQLESCVESIAIQKHDGERQTEPNLSPQPIAIVDTQSFSVVQLNMAAHQLGITQGMGLAMALSLSDGVSHTGSNSVLVIKEYKPELESERLVEVATRLYRLTADIVLAPPQGLFLRIDSMLKLYKDMTDYWLAITTAISDLRLSFYYANAPTPLMAQVLAESKTNTLFTSDIQARTALANLPIETLKITNKQKEQLSRVGIKYVKQLLDIPLKDLSKRFDLSMFTYLGQLTGELQTKFSYFQPQLEYRRTLELMFEITNANVLKHPITKLLKELEAYLQIRNLVTNQIYFEFCYRYNEFVTMSVNRGGGEYRTGKWLELIVLKLESLKLAEPVVSIRIHCQSLFSQQARITDMFNARSSVVDEQELQAVLQAKLSADQVCTIHYKESVEPNKATSIKRLTDSNLPSQESVRQPNKTSKRSKVKPTKKELPSKPFDIRPSYIQQTPSFLTETISILEGPERIMAGWWDFSPYCRDYFVAENKAGQRMWVYRTPAQEWFVHGYFS